MSRSPALILREGDRERLAELARLPSVPSGLAKSARMVLLASDGVPNAQIACGVPKVCLACELRRWPGQQ